jgi:hypothetical protein
LTSCSGFATAASDQSTIVEPTERERLVHAIDPCAVDVRDRAERAVMVGSVLAGHVLGQHPAALAIEAKHARHPDRRGDGRLGGEERQHRRLEPDVPVAQDGRERPEPFLLERRPGPGLGLLVPARPRPGRAGRRNRRAAELGDALLEAGPQRLRNVDALRRHTVRSHGLELPQAVRRVAVDVLGDAQEPRPRKLVEMREPSVHGEDPAARGHERVLLHQPSTPSSGAGTRSSWSASTSTGR